MTKTVQTSTITLDLKNKRLIVQFTLHIQDENFETFVPYGTLVANDEFAKFKTQSQKEYKDLTAKNLYSDFSKNTNIDFTKMIG